MKRRHALSFIAALPFVARLQAQTRASARHHIALSQTVGLLLDPGGTLKVWGQDPGASENEPQPAAYRMGLGHQNPVDKFALYPIPGSCEKMPNPL